MAYPYVENVDAKAEKVNILIRKIDNHSSYLNRVHVCYLYESLVPTQTNDFFELHHSLCQSKLHYPFAVALTGYILEKSGSLDMAAEISKVATAGNHTFADVQLPDLALREILADVARKLEDKQAKELVGILARCYLELDPKHIVYREDGKERNGFEAVLLAFTRMQDVLLLHTGNDGINDIEKELKTIKRNDLAAHLKRFIPTRGYHLAVDSDIALFTDVSMALPLGLDPMKKYQSKLRDAYAVMPEIPHNQWPPVKKAQYVSLALIKNEDMMRTDLYSRATIHGSVDDVMKTKEDIPFEDVFPKQLKTEFSRVTLIEGRPGCGKTTLIVKVCKDWGAEKILEGARCLILVEVRRFMGKSNITLEDILSIYCPHPNITKAVKEQIERDQGEKVIFAFDGLDEYPHAIKDNLISSIIHGVMLRKCFVFMTSRPAFAHSLRKTANRNIEIIGFLKNQIKHYINAYYEHKPVSAKSLIEFLDNHPNIDRMCYLPLHLAMVAYLHENVREMPKTETEMYKIFVLHTILRALRKEKENDSDPEAMDEIEFHEYSDLPEDKEKILREIFALAFKFTEEQKQVITGKEIMRRKGLPVTSSRKNFDSLGLLTVDRQLSERALPTKTFSFLHLTLQEYLTAKYISEMSDEQQLDIIRRLKEKIHMRVVWKFYCGLAHEKRVFPETFTLIVEGARDDRQSALHIMRCAYESTEAKACVTVMESINGKMDVQDITLNPADCDVLGYVTTFAADTICELDMSYCHIGAEGMEAFVDRIESLDGPLQKVKILRLRARIDLKPLGRKGAPALLRLLDKLPNLHELRLYGNEIHPDKCRMLVPSIKKMTSLETLILSRNSLDKTTGKAVAEILENLQHLTEFYISYNPLGDEGLKDMLPGLIKCRELEILGLRGNRLGKESGTVLSELLKELPSLKWLILYQNDLGDGGVMNMLPGLYSAPCLEELSLVKNHIGDIGAVGLAGFLRSTNTLLRARIYYNDDISEKGKMAIRRSVLDRPSTMVSLQCAI